MPSKAVDYSKTLIYKIQHKQINELLYVGHTTDFTSRKAKHKKALRNHSPLQLYRMIEHNGGWEEFNMVVVELFPCKTKQEACLREDAVMRGLHQTSYDKPYQAKDFADYYQCHINPTRSRSF